MCPDLFVVTGQSHVEKVIFFSDFSEGETDVSLEIIPLEAELF